MMLVKALGTQMGVFKKPGDPQNPKGETFGRNFLEREVKGHFAAQPGFYLGLKDLPRRPLFSGNNAEN